MLHTFVTNSSETQMRITALLLPLCFYIFSGIHGQPLRTSTYYGYAPGYGYALVGDISIDGQMMHALIDTGTSALLYVWSTWFCHFYEPGSRSNLPIGYYQCPGSCSPIQPTDLHYLDGTKVDVFQHKGNARIGQTDVGSIKFGLVYKYESPSDAPPIHSIGLGTQVYPGYPSFMSQLQGKVVDTSFTLYLRAHRCGAVTGELLLRGGDPSLYVAPLTFIPLRSQGYHVVEIGSLQVGSRHKTIGINQDAVIDSGAEGLFVPNMYFEGLIKDIFDEATALAGVPIHPQWVPEARLYEFDCAFNPQEIWTSSRPLRLAWARLGKLRYSLPIMPEILEVFALSLSLVRLPLAGRYRPSSLSERTSSFGHPRANLGLLNSRKTDLRALP